MSNLTRDLDRAYKKKVIEPFEKKIKTIAIIADAELVRNTPVDTGRARANWLPSLDVPDLTLIPPSESGARNSVTREADLNSKLTNFSFKNTIYISNNLPYIERLNDGHSSQAPAGFVESALSVARNAL